MAGVAPRLAASALLIALTACGHPSGESNGAPHDRPEASARGIAWSLSEEARASVSDPELERRIFAALDGASEAGTDPSISHFHVRAGTVVEHHGSERTIVGGNSEYAGYPEAIHGETSLMNHVISTIGPESARAQVDFLAFYTEGQCGGGGSCGDCRDYLMTTTRWKDLVIACGQAGDGTVYVHRFADSIVPESDFPEVSADETGLSPSELAALTEAAIDARGGGISLFTTAEEHLGVAVLSHRGEIYRAAGTDDAAFHYRYPVGAALQQAATYRDYLVKAVAVVGAPGELPRLSYRDRQYGFELSSFNLARDLPPIDLIVVVEEASGPTYRRTTFEDALPGAFSTADFMPEALARFLDERVPD